MEFLSYPQILMYLFKKNSLTLLRSILSLLIELPRKIKSVMSDKQMTLGSIVNRHETSQ